MHKDKTLSMLGLARRAGKLSMGHDMALQAVLNKRAQMIIFCADISPRLVKELKKTFELHSIDIPFFETEITIEEIHHFVGYKAGVLTVNDENFSKKIISLLTDTD